MLNGIAYHPPSRRLYVTGKKWDYMYQVRITPKLEAGPSEVSNWCQLGLSPHHKRGMGPVEVAREDVVEVESPGAGASVAPGGAV